MAKSASNSKLYLKNALLFLLVALVVYVPQSLPWLRPVREFFVRHTGWNWGWPLALFLGTVMGTFLIQVDREAEAKNKMRLAGFAFILIYFVLRLGIPHGQVTAARLAGIPFLFFSSFLEEFLFRRIGFEALRKLEEKFYRDQNMKRLGPISLLYVSVVVGVMQGLGPLIAGTGGFGWLTYAAAFDASVFYSFLYVLTRSVWVPGLAHFLTNLAKILW